jgi:hypothetical protein
MLRCFTIRDEGGQGPYFPFVDSLIDVAVVPRIVGYSYHSHRKAHVPVFKLVFPNPPYIFTAAQSAVANAIANLDGKSTSARLDRKTRLLRTAQPLTGRKSPDLN